VHSLCADSAHGTWVQDYAPPSGELLEYVKRDFGSLDALVKKFSATAVGVQGSGWGVSCGGNLSLLDRARGRRLTRPCSLSSRQWLGYDKAADKLVVGATSNQDPCSTLGLVPVLGVDVWEHAYYLQYKNVRPDYVKAIWEVVNWKNVAENLSAAKKA
jgi:superoxide dismutase, Fe-Mn family